MILRPVANLVAYRLHHPKWAHVPSSGQGAALKGGRFNRPGVDALYLSLELDTAIEEYRQTSKLLPPATMVSYELSVSAIVDFSGGYVAGPTWHPLWSDYSCAWRTLWFGQRIEPPSWVLSDYALAAGAKGIMFPSQAKPGGTNLVVYPARLDGNDALTPYDPDNFLPTTQQAWPP